MSEVPLKVSIVGCGWLGLPLAKKLIGPGYHVLGSTSGESRIPLLAAAGIDCHTINFRQVVDAHHPMQNCDVMIVTIPPGPMEFRQTVHQNIAGFAAGSGAKFFVYISSTSVYPDRESALSEDDADLSTETGKLETIYNASLNRLCILRFGGLFGPARSPGKFLAGKSGVAKPLAPVNMTHLDDAVDAIISVVTLQKTGVFNVVSPVHPDRKTFYTTLAKRENLQPPQFDEADKSSGKLILSDKILLETNFVFSHPDPMG